MHTNDKSELESVQDQASTLSLTSKVSAASFVHALRQSDYHAHIGVNWHLDKMSEAALRAIDQMHCEGLTPDNYKAIDVHLLRAQVWLAAARELVLRRLAASVAGDGQ